MHLYVAQAYYKHIVIDEFKTFTVFSFILFSPLHDVYFYTKFVWTWKPIVTTPQRSQLHLVDLSKGLGKTQHMTWTNLVKCGEKCILCEENQQKWLPKQAI